MESATAVRPPVIDDLAGPRLTRENGSREEFVKLACLRLSPLPAGRGWLVQIGIYCPGRIRHIIRCCAHLLLDFDSFVASRRRGPDGSDDRCMGPNIDVRGDFRTTRLGDELCCQRRRYTSANRHEGQVTSSRCSQQATQVLACRCLSLGAPCRTVRHKSDDSACQDGQLRHQDLGRRKDAKNRHSGR